MSAELIETAAIVTTERKRQRVIVLKASPSASDYKSKKTKKTQLTLTSCKRIADVDKEITCFS